MSLNQSQTLLVLSIFIICISFIKGDEITRMTCEKSVEKSKCGKEEKIEGPTETTIKITFPLNAACKGITSVCDTDDFTCTSTNSSKGYGGDSCKTDEDCKGSMKCGEGKCIPIEDGDICKEHYECKKSSFCDHRSLCHSLLKEGDICYEDEYCGFGLLCTKNESSDENKVCTKILSKIPGQYGERGVMCESLFVNEDGICVETRLKNSNSNETCNNDHDCTYIVGRSGTTVEKNGECRMNYEGAYFCQVTSTSTSAKKIRNIINYYNDKFEDYVFHSADEKGPSFPIINKGLKELMSGNLVGVSPCIFDSIFGFMDNQGSDSYLSITHLILFFSLLATLI